MAAIEQTYIHVNNRPQSVNQEIHLTTSQAGLNTIQRAYQTQHSHTYNPLQGVPFEINPVYSMNADGNRKADNSLVSLFYFELRSPERNNQIKKFHN